LIPLSFVVFYITEKFSKKPLYNEEGYTVIPEGAVVVYNPKELSQVSDEELKEYCEELILYWGLEWEPEDFMNGILITALVQSLPKDREKAKEVIRRTPGLSLIEDDKNIPDA